MRIGLIDSGIGGLTVLKELVRRYPDNEYVYYGDTLNNPYGNKSRDELYLLSSKMINYLINKEVDLIVVACGTICSNVFEKLQEKSSVKLYSVIEPVISYINNYNEKIGVIATRMTIESGLFNKLCFKRECPMFVPLIENRKFMEIDKYIDEIVEAGVNIEGTKGLEEFNALKAKFVKVVDTSSVTDDDFVKIDVNFSCEITPDSINKNNFRVEQAGVELDFELEELVDEGKVTGVRIVAENTMNYIDDIKVTVFGNIKNAEDESFTLGNSYEFVAEHKAPSVYIKNVSKNGNNIKVELSNNSQEEKTYALTVAIYTNDDEMKDCYIKTGKLAENLIIDDISFDIQADDRLECYLLETFTSMKSANCLMEVK